jgi:peptidoglycan/xylan/chitin deacetylase (PgdA/CDA1 family)
MAARTLLAIRRFLPRGVLAAGLLVLLIFGIDSSGFALLQPSIAQEHTPMPTSTPTPSPIPSPTPSPSPLPYLLWHGNPNLREIALTFDDGPAPDTPVILNILKRYHIHATFFMLGIWVQQFPDITRQVIADGNPIGDHTWNHPDLTQLGKSQAIKQITDTRNIIQRTTGVVTTFCRPPYGAYTHSLLNTISSLHFSTVLWNSDPRDWARPGVSSIINYVLNNAQNGSIILMHDGGGDRSQTIAALPTIIETLQARGFTFVTIPQMIMHLPPTS